MTESSSDLLPEGLEDRLPVAAAKATRIMRAVLDTMDAHGYDRVRPPIMEFERSLATRMANDGSNDAAKDADTVSTRKMFRFTDPASLRTLALRSDMTVQIGRIAATVMQSAPRPLRLSYAGDVAVMRADQLDPARQRLQLGAELIGNDSVAAAGEIVSLAIEALEAAGAAGISVDLTLPDLVDTLSAKALPLQPEQANAVRRELDTKDAGGLKAAGGEAYLPLLYATGPFGDAIERLRAVDAGGALASRIKGLEQVAARIGDRARVTLDPTERHGFEYQSWFGFTIHAEGVRGALGRGGTYRIAGTDEVATGFSLYADPLVRALSDEAARDTLFLPLGHDEDVAARLRTIGWRTVAALADGDDPAALGCTHRLEGAEPKLL